MHVKLKRFGLIFVTLVVFTIPFLFAPIAEAQRNVVEVDIPVPSQSVVVDDVDKGFVFYTRINGEWWWELIASPCERLAEVQQAATWRCHVLEASLEISDVDEEDEGVWIYTPTEESYLVQREADNMLLVKRESDGHLLNGFSQWYQSDFHEVLGDGPWLEVRIIPSN